VTVDIGKPRLTTVCITYSEAGLLMGYSTARDGVGTPSDGGIQHQHAAGKGTEVLWMISFAMIPASVPRLTSLFSACIGLLLFIIGEYLSFFIAARKTHIEQK